MALKLAQKIRRMKAETVFVLSYLTVILIGGVLLWLPFSQKVHPLSFLDALFTSTSALCVTGLTVVDTGSRFSGIGQGVILVLIQTGGLGITTYSVWFFLSLGRNVGIKSRFYLQSVFSPRPLDEIRGLLRLIFQYTFLIEGIGALLLFLYWSPVYPVPRALYLAVFHSVSAFCNAGFSLFPDSLVGYRDSYLVNLTLIGLIVSGGIGFPVAYELMELFCKKRAKVRVRMSLHTRLVLIMTLVLILGGAGLIYGIEYNDALERCSFFSGLLAALFQSVTARTAGFNTLEMASLTNASLLLLILLMFIGASPGSCGGGIRTTTFAVLGGLLWNRLNGKRRVHLFHRTVPEEVVSRAMVLFSLAVSIILFMTALILIVESGNLPFPMAKGKLMEVLFEVVSAFGTVGLSLGITGALEPASKILLILTMFLGRVGILSLGYSIARAGERYPVSYGEEGVMTG